MESPASPKPSFTEMYSDFYPTVYSLLYSSVKDHYQTDDLCQEVFMRYFKKYNEINNHRSWILGTMRFVLIEHFRNRNGHTNDVDLDSALDDVKMTFVNGFRDTRIMIEEALDSLGYFGDERNRTLFDLIALYQYTYKDAGKYLGMTERQVRYKYSLIVQKLMDHFKEKGIHGLEDLL
jgi:RNA polymerase sigma factor (sigma-70 family)